MYNKIFFTNVLRVLHEQQMTKQQLAELTGVSISFLSDLTNGNANPSLKVMEQIAQGLNIPLPALLEMHDLDEKTMQSLSNGKTPDTLPKGYRRISAILSDYQAFTVQQWNDANRKAIAKHRTHKTPE